MLRDQKCRCCRESWSLCRTKPQAKKQMCKGRQEHHPTVDLPSQLFGRQGDIEIQGEAVRPGRQLCQTCCLCAEWGPD